MPLEDIYTFDWMQRVDAMERTSARVMTDTIFTGLRPSSVLDLGAGPCTHANLLSGYGCEVTVVDGSIYAADFADPGVRFIHADLTRPLDLQQTFDVVLCLEVIEHLPEEAETVLLETMVGHTAQWLVATASSPGQKGRHHINMKPLSYWIEKIKDLGLIHESRLVTQWRESWNAQNVLDYFINNLMIFSRKGNPKMETKIGGEFWRK
jgi:SAM-dependent methyltransferase